MGGSQRQLTASTARLAAQPTDVWPSGGRSSAAAGAAVPHCGRADCPARRRAAMPRRLARRRPPACAQGVDPGEHVRGCGASRRRARGAARSARRPGPGRRRLWVQPVCPAGTFGGRL